VGSIPITRSNAPARMLPFVRSRCHNQKVPPMIVVTTNDLPGFRIVRHLGVVRGITVRSRSVVGNIGAAVQIFFGGNITVYTKLAEQTRQEAFNLLIQHANEVGANAVLSMRYDANEIASAVTEVLAYGTAVVVEPIDGYGLPGDSFSSAPLGGPTGSGTPWASR
jgi:uncharacterized protein YbjQ (UPF0145 family)